MAWNPVLGRRVSIGWRPGRSAIAALVAGTVLVPAGIGLLASVNSRYALLAGAAVLFIGVASVNIDLIILLAVPFTLVVERVGGSGTNLSLSDFVLFVATLAAIFHFRPSLAPALRRLLALLFVYQASTLLTVLDYPYRADIVEWFHEAVLVGGSLVVGWVIGYHGRTRVAFSAYLVGACAIALWAIGYCLTHQLHAANLPLSMQKNYVGDMLSFAVLLAYARPAWIGWVNKRLLYGCMALCLFGILASESKQAIIAVVIGVVVILLREGTLQRRSKAIVLAVLPLVIVAYEVISKEVKSHNRFDSYYQRLSWYRDSFHIWHLSPLLGVGLRWWYTSRFLVSFQPPNAEMEMLTSVGVLGLLGFLVMMIGALVVLWKVPREWGTLAFVVLLMRFVQGQLDIFWVGAQGSIPWLIAGVALGAMALARRRASSPTMLADPVTV